MPPIVDSDAVIEPASSSIGIRVTGVLGDQQASLLGLGCRRPGMAKMTLGTGAFVLAQAGTETPAPPPGVLASCAWRRRGETSYALEGFIPTAGAALDWFAGLGMLPPASELDALLGAAGPEDGSIACVPALQGLGTPAWNASVHGALLGLTRATTQAQVARAVVDGVLHQVADAIAAINVSMPLRTVLLDGGMSRSDWIVQRLADLADVRVERSAQSGATAVGAAVIAGLSAGFWRASRSFRRWPWTWSRNRGWRATSEQRYALDGPMRSPWPRSGNPDPDPPATTAPGQGQLLQASQAPWSTISCSSTRIGTRRLSFWIAVSSPGSVNGVTVPQLSQTR